MPLMVSTLRLLAAATSASGRAGLELVQDFSRLGVETRRNLLLAPARLHLLLDLVERALARRGDPATSYQI